MWFELSHLAKYQTYLNTVTYVTDKVYKNANINWTMYALSMRFSYRIYTKGFTKSLTSCCMHWRFGICKSIHNVHLLYGTVWWESLLIYIFRRSAVANKQAAVANDVLIVWLFFFSFSALYSIL